MKIKDFPDTTNLQELLVEIPLKIQERNPYYKKSDPKISGYIISAWEKGVWLRRPDINKTQVFPFFLESFEELQEFEVIV